MSRPLRCVVVEDEPQARANLLAYLQRAPEVEVVAEAADGLQAVARIDAAEPDLVLLDVQLPELDGIAVLRRIHCRPEVVFTTAHQSYAVTAFELGAVDYLVKPFGSERLLAAIRRVTARRVGTDGGPPAVERALAAAAAPLERFFARKGNRIVPIATADIVRAETSGEYTRVLTAHDSVLVRVTLRELAALLDPRHFEQIHRAHLVSLAAIAHLQPIDDRRLLVTLRDGREIVASRAGSQRLRRLVR
ncbi:MAG TPA: LytTR family DNA-binding domain-containing protein [Thermoanaerobaculia bacterium]|nr:LytTR family DNA-binding domain-containing protein [Thermoanaerobaculia bacterium]